MMAFHFLTVGGYYFLHLILLSHQLIVRKWKLSSYFLILSLFDFKSSSGSNIIKKGKRILLDPYEEDEIKWKKGHLLQEGHHYSSLNSRFHFYYSKNNRKRGRGMMSSEEDARKCCPKVALQLSFIVAASQGWKESRHS